MATEPGGANATEPGTSPPGALPNGPPAASAGGTACTQGLAPRIYRLSAAQYSNAVRDLLGLAEGPIVTGDTAAAVSFFPSDESQVQPGLASGFAAAAAQALDAVDLDGLTGCAVATDADACARAFITDFATRAFGRTLDPADIEDLMTLPTSPYVLGAQLDVNNGIRLALESILQAPSFVYRRELAPSGRLDAFETATQLGYVFRNSLPDDALRQAAAAGELETNEQILQQVTRLLQQAEVQANLTRIVGGWFAVDRVLAAQKDPVVFPAFSGNNLQQSLLQSVNLFIGDVLWGTPAGGSLADLLTSPRVFVNQALAELYGIPFAGQTPETFLPFDDGVTWKGILTQPAITAGSASAVDTSIVRRGLLLARNVLCLPTPSSPPPAVAAQVSAQLADTSQTERQKSDSRLITPPCSSCHPIFDPYGVMLETYDSIGRFRTSDALGQAINASTLVPEGLVLGLDQQALDTDATEPVLDVADFVQRLSQIDGGNQFAVCANSQMLSYTLGQALPAGCDVQGAVGQANLSMTIPQIFSQLIVSPLVRERIAALGGQ